MFSATEALGLVMAVLDGHHDASDPTDPVGSALGKIVRALPEPVAAQAEAVRRATAPAPDRAAARPDPETTAALVRACSDHRRVRLGYRSEAGSEWDAEVDPWAVVVRHGRWYMLCWSHTSDGRRAYRIDRIRAVEVLDAGFDPPADLDPVADARGASRGRLGVLRRGRSSTRRSTRSARCVPRTLGRLEPVDAGPRRLVGRPATPGGTPSSSPRCPVAFRIVRGARGAPHRPHARRSGCSPPPGRQSPPLSGCAIPAHPGAPGCPSLTTFRNRL